MKITKEKLLLRLRMELARRGMTRLAFCHMYDLSYANFTHWVLGRKKEINDKEKTALSDFLKIKI